jgi:molybdopterin molybdotransferase
MIVFEMVVRPFVEHVGGLLQPYKINLKRSALLSRNLSSAQGRIDYVRVRLSDKNGTLWAEPILGKSGLINTMITADGLIEIGLNSEGLEKGAEVDVILF